MSVDKKTLIGTDMGTASAQLYYENPNTLAAAVATNELIRMGKIIDQYIHNVGAVFAKRDL